MTRVIIKIGDVFSVLVDDNSKKYFQYIANDMTQLNSDVIAVFKKKYAIKENLELSQIVKDEVDFYAHCVIKWGIKMNLWIKVGQSKEIRKVETLFRCSNDYGRKLGEEPIKISSNWRVWKINEEFRQVGKLVGESQKAEIGIVVSPTDVVHRMINGEYNFEYPRY